MVEFTGDGLRVVKLLVAVIEETVIYTAEAIEYEGDVWLVPMWIEDLERGMRRPERIISVGGFGLRPLGPDWTQDFRLERPLHKAVLSGPIPPELAQSYVVIDQPNMVFRIPRGTNRLQ